jgi:hypothetical protein
VYRFLVNLTWISPCWVVDNKAPSSHLAEMR